jgi:hypothetical protein
LNIKKFELKINCIYGNNRYRSADAVTTRSSLSTFISFTPEVTLDCILISSEFNLIVLLFLVTIKTSWESPTGSTVTGENEF